MNSPSNDITARGNDELLRVDDLKVHFPVTKGLLFKRTVGVVKAVDGVSFTIGRGETLGLVGESGCGKSTTSLAVLRMQPVTAGRIVFEGTDITAQDRSSGTFRRRMQMVYQDPYGSLDPRMMVRDIVGEPLTVHGLTPTRAAYTERVAALLTTVGLLPAMAERYPHEFSGGQRQRIAIARALALEPSLVICDEPVSALDVSIQAQVINVLMELQQRLKLSYLFVAHDLAVVRHISHRVAVMYLGRIVEIAARDTLFREPLHPYTQALLSAVPVADPAAEKLRPRQVLRGEVPSVMRPPAGCHFHPRCPHAMVVCREQSPPLRTLDGGRDVACHLHDKATIPIREAERGHEPVPAHRRMPREAAGHAGPAVAGAAGEGTA
jgi:oligopeptide transport system ATP-binding protein